MWALTSTPPACWRQRIGELHLALLEDGDDSDFAPEPFSESPAALGLSVDAQPSGTGYAHAERPALHDARCAAGTGAGDRYQPEPRREALRRVPQTSDE